jgi:hypothetical protein
VRPLVGNNMGKTSENVGNRPETRG